MSEPETATDKPTVPNDPVVIALRKPIKFGSRTITEITVRPVKAKHMRAIKPTDGAMATAILMASKLSGELPEVIDELEGEDLRDVLRAVDDFFSVIHGNGGMP